MNTWIYKVLVVVAVIITTWVLEVNGAYQHLPCPSVCRSLKFQSIQYVYCNSTGIQEVPRGIPPNTELLDLSYTMIQSIPKDAFIGLVNLGELDLSSNGLKDDNIADGALECRNSSQWIYHPTGSLLYLPACHKILPNSGSCKTPW